MKKTLFIFGASGFIGSNLASHFRKRYRVIGSYFNNPIQIPGVLTVRCDVLAKQQVQAILHAFRPDYVFYAVGLRSMKDCQDFPKVANALNTAGLYNVATFSERYQAQIFFFSSAFVFGGQDRCNRVHEPSLPVTVYGETMAASEFFIQKSCLNYFILRCSNFYGRSANYRQLSWFEHLERVSFHNQNVVCDNSLCVGFLDVFFLINALEEIMVKGLTNRLMHLSSTDVVSHFDFARLYADAFEANAEHFRAGTWDFPVNHAKHKNLDVDFKNRYELDLSVTEMLLGLKLPSVNESLLSTKARLGGGKSSSGRSKGVSFI